jgi:hypothetical protein
VGVEQAAGEQVQIETQYQESLSIDAAGDSVLVNGCRAGRWE